MIRTKYRSASRCVSPLLQRMMRNAFSVEPLEQRVLLSADPLLAAVNVVLPRSGDDMDAIHEGMGQRPDALGGALTSAGSSVQSGYDLALEPAGPSFSVDWAAFGVGGVSLRSAYLDAALPADTLDDAKAPAVDGVFSDESIQLPLSASSENLASADWARNSLGDPLDSTVASPEHAPLQWLSLVSGNTDLASLGPNSSAQGSHLMIQP